MSAMRATLAPELDDLGDIHQQPRRWEAFWREWLAQCRAYENVAAFCKNAWAMVGVRPEMLPQAASTAMRTSGSACNVAAVSRRRIRRQFDRCHCIRVHGTRRMARHFVLGTVCPVCGNDLHDRMRVMLHMERGSLRCRMAFATLHCQHSGDRCCRGRC